MPGFDRLFLAVLCASIGMAGPRVAMAADEGEEVYRESCTGCHTAKTRPLDDVHQTREKWKEAVDRMEGMGTEVPSGKKLSALLDYLERTHGPAGAAPAEKK